LSGATPFLGAGNIAAWFPPEASPQAYWLDKAFGSILVAVVFAVVLVFALAVTYVVQFRRRDENVEAAEAGRPNPVLLGLWIVAAAGLGYFAFTADFCGYLDRNVPPYGAESIDVTAKQWDWTFTYPGGHIADTLHVEMNKPVVLNLTSADVAHALSIPALRINQGILPGRITHAWFQADLPDTFDLRSSVYSGEWYADMHTALIVHRPEDYAAWRQSIDDIFAGRSLPEVGELLYNRKGCAACHSVDGSARVGPSFLDMYGNTFATHEGVDVTVDAAYVRESILTPNVSVIAGFEPVMTPYEGSITDREIEALTEWFKTLSSFAAADQEGN
jgi:cytochrome c oxidase subunit II